LITKCDEDEMTQVGSTDKKGCGNETKPAGAWSADRFF